MAYIDPYTGYEVLYPPDQQDPNGYPAGGPSSGPYTPPHGAYDPSQDPNEPPADTPPPAPTPPATPPTTPPAADPWATAPADGNWQAWFRSNLGRDTLTSAELIGLEASLGKAGVKVLRNSQGIAGKVQLPSGQIVDVIEAAGAGGNRFQWLVGDGGNGGGAPPNPEYTNPWTEAPPDTGTVPTFNAPGDFEAPTAESILKDPSYLWRAGQGRSMLENSAAAKGVLNSGGTLKDIVNYGQGAASQEYGSVWDRSMGLWNSNWNNALTSFRANKDVSDTSYNRALGSWKDRRDTYYTNQNNAWQKYLDSIRVGAGA